MSSRAMPTVIPVRFALLGDRIVFWADAHDHPETIADNTVLGFQADDIDPATHGGWSVQVVGLASHVREPAALASLEGATPRGWSDGTGPLISLSLDRGRRTPSVERRRHRGRAMTGPGPPRAALEELERDECLVLLRSFTVGRVAIVTASGSVLVVPVNYVVDGEAIVFRSDAGEKLEHLDERPASFQIDFIDSYHRAGWSVLVQGVAYHASPSEVEHLDIVSWAGRDKSHWVRVVPARITGRRLVPPDLPLDVRGYL